MKMQQMVKTLVCSLWLVAFVGMAQTPVQVRMVAPVAQAGGTVTGHVYCSDTQRPARFADVELLQSVDYGGRNRGGGSAAPQYQSVGRGRTALDGSFTIMGVPAGDYYVTGTMTGYVSPVAVSRMTQSAIAGVPMTHVDANRSADVVVSMERGAVVSGHVAYDDGSPLPGVNVRLRPITTSDANGRLGLMGGLFVGGGGGDVGYGQTDDRGVFRLPGVPPGRYTVIAVVQTESIGQGRSMQGTFRAPPPILNVYAPATMRKADAQVVEIHGGETIEGIDVRVALNGLRTVQGSVEAKADGHMLNGGMVSLADATDGSLTRSAGIDSDGTFRIEYLPPGTYTLTVQGEDRPQPGSRTAMKRYERGNVSVTVGDSDVTVDTVQLDESKSSSGGS